MSARGSKVMTSSSLENNSEGCEKQVFSFPASLAQQRLWSFQQKQPRDASYNISSGARIHGRLEFKVLQSVFNEIVRRHESLRTHFGEINGAVHQIISLDNRAWIQVVDVTAKPIYEQEAEIQRRIEVEARTPFDLSCEPLLRITLFRLSEQEHIIQLIMHHIISDGWSFSILLREMAVLYEAFSAGRPSPLPELPIQYVDFTAWQQELLRGEIMDREWAYWQRQFAGSKLFEFPSDMLQSPPGGNEAEYLRFRIAPQESSKLERLAHDRGATLYMVAFAALAVVLYRCTGNSDMVIGSPIAGRSRMELESLIGLVTNRLLLRIDLTGNPTFAELLQRTKKTILEGFEHALIPFEELALRMHGEWKISRPQVDFVFQNTPSAKQYLGAWKLQPLEINTKTAKLDLTVFMSQSGAEIWSSAKYRPGRLKEAMIVRMYQGFHNLLVRIGSSVDERIADIPIFDNP